VHVIYEKIKFENQRSQLLQENCVKFLLSGNFTEKASYCRDTAPIEKLSPEFEISVVHLPNENFLLKEMQNSKSGDGLQ